jgi:hypothetical protein
MSAGPIDARLAHLEGAFEQVNERLGTLERRMEHGFGLMDHRFNSVEQRSDQRFNSLEQRFDQRFNWLIGTVIATWITTILTVVLHH